jgi:hypothetical protein
MMERDKNEERSKNWLSDKCRIITLDEVEISVIEMLMMEKFCPTKIGQTKCRSTEYFYHIRDLYSAKLAFCKLFKVYPYWALDSEYPGYDAAIDLEYSWGVVRRTVHVEQTLSKDGKLIADTGGKTCDLYALMVGQFPTFTYRGWILREMLFRLENTETIGGRRVYAVEQDCLSIDFPFRVDRA